MISIIIPALNEEKVIEATIRQFEKMTLPHEIIISDGKSNDKTVEISRKWAAKVAAYTDKERQTIAAGRNAGAKLAIGEFLVFLDADCVIKNPDEFFTKAMARFSDPKIVAISARLEVLAEFQTLGDKVFFGFSNGWFYLLNDVFHKGAAAGEFQMMRREAFDKVHGFQEHLTVAEDADMFIRLSKIGKTYFDMHLTVFHTGRRAHKIGWPKLLSLWIINNISMTFRKKSFSKEWTPIR